MEEVILQAIVNLRFVRLGKDGKSPQEIIDTLRRLLFVKVHADELLTIRLHDEMARLVRQYLFSDFGDDISGERQREFQQAIPGLYDVLIQAEQQRERNETHVLTKQDYQVKLAQMQYGRTLQQDLNSTQGLEQAYNNFIELKTQTMSSYSNFCPEKCYGLKETIQGKDSGISL